jgi:hypothetical protein
MAQFNNASIMTRLAAGNCAESTGTGANQAPFSCASTLGLGGGQATMQQFTDESNNLTVVPSTLTPLALTTDGKQNLETQFLSATGSTPQCNATPHAFVRDYDLDDGATPSNANGQAFIILLSGLARSMPEDGAIARRAIRSRYAYRVGLHGNPVSQSMCRTETPVAVTSMRPSTIGN